MALLAVTWRSYGGQVHDEMRQEMLLMARTCDKVLQLAHQHLDPSSLLGPEQQADVLSKLLRKMEMVIRIIVSAPSLK